MIDSDVRNVNHEFRHKAATIDVALWPVTPPRPQFPHGSKAKSQALPTR